MKYDELTIEDAFVLYHISYIASVCDGDTQEIEAIAEME
jgi:hypothetical protein